MQFKTLFLCRRRTIGLAPLIDVVFILLLFFMLTTSFVQWREIPIAVPAASSEPQAKNIRLLRLEEEDGTFLYENRIYWTQDLAALRMLVAEQPDAVYATYAAPKVRTQVLINLLDQLKQAGATHLSLTETPLQ